MNYIKTETVNDYEIYKINDFCINMVIDRLTQERDSFFYSREMREHVFDMLNQTKDEIKLPVKDNTRHCLIKDLIFQNKCKKLLGKPTFQDLYKIKQNEINFWLGRKAKNALLINKCRTTLGEERAGFIDANFPEDAGGVLDRYRFVSFKQKDKPKFIGDAIRELYRSSGTGKVVIKPVIKQYELDSTEERLLQYRMNVVTKNLEFMRGYIDELYCKIDRAIQSKDFELVKKYEKVLELNKNEHKFLVERHKKMKKTYPWLKYTLPKGIKEDELTAYFYFMKSWMRTDATEQGFVIHPVLKKRYQKFINNLIAAQCPEEAIEYYDQEYVDYVMNNLDGYLSE